MTNSSGPTSWEWLAQIAEHDETVRLYLDIYRKEFNLHPYDYRTVAVSPAAMVGLANTLVDAKKRAQAAYREYLERHYDPVLIVDKNGHISPLRPSSDETLGLLRELADCLGGLKIVTRGESDALLARLAKYRSPR